jgi:hypothetical protein
LQTATSLSATITYTSIAFDCSTQDIYFEDFDFSAEYETVNLCITKKPTDITIDLIMTVTDRRYIELAYQYQSNGGYRIVIDDISTGTT